jgi:hypothetical protein
MKYFKITSECGVSNAKYLKKMEDIAIYTRNKTSGNFQGSLPVDDLPNKTYFSPDKKYFFEMAVFSKPINGGVTFGSYFFAKIEIFERESQKMIFETLHNHSSEAHQWVEVGGKTYLFFAEFQNGMTVYNVTDKTQNSFLAEDSHYQIIQYFPSPDALKMATVEYGLQNLLVKIYDISKPIDLPFPVVYHKIIENNNGKQVKTIDWHGSGYIDIVHHEQIQICRTSLKVQVIDISDDKFSGKCRFEDIHGNEFYLYEKWQGMFGFEADENTVFPLESSISVEIIELYTKNNQKIAHVNVDLGYYRVETQLIEVLESQLETYWYHQNYTQ